jgi:hypothetical protein
MILSENRHPLFRDHDVNAKSPDGPGVGYIEGDADDVRTEPLIMTVGPVGE